MRAIYRMLKYWFIVVIFFNIPNVYLSDEKDDFLKELHQFETLTFSKEKNKKDYDKYISYVTGDWRISRVFTYGRHNEKDTRHLVGTYIKIEGNKIYLSKEFDNLAYYYHSIENTKTGDEIKDISLNFDTAAHYFEDKRLQANRYGFYQDREVAIAGVRLEKSKYGFNFIHITPTRMLAITFSNVLLLEKENHRMFKDFNEFEYVKVSKNLNRNDYDIYMNYLRGHWRIKGNVIYHWNMLPTLRAEKLIGTILSVSGDRILFPESFYANNIIGRKRKKKGDKIDFIACAVGQTYEFFSDGGPNDSPDKYGLEVEQEIAMAEIHFIGEKYTSTTLYHLTPEKMKMRVGSYYFSLEKVE